MAAITAFPDILSTVFGQYGVDVTYTATTAILAGQVVQLDDSDGEQIEAAATTPVAPLGVAIEDIAAGATGTVRVSGVAVVANSDASTAIKPGALLTVTAFAGAVAAFTGGTATTVMVGMAIDPIAGGGTGRMLINIGVVPKAGA